MSTISIFERQEAVAKAVQRSGFSDYSYGGSLPIMLDQAQEAASQHASGNAGAYVRLPISVLDIRMQEGPFFRRFTVSYTLDFGNGPETAEIPFRSSLKLWTHYQGFLLGRESVSREASSTRRKN